MKTTGATATLEKRSDSDGVCGGDNVNNGIAYGAVFSLLAWRGRKTCLVGLAWRGRKWTCGYCCG